MTKKRLDSQAHSDIQISLPSLEFSKIIRKSCKKKHFVFKTKIVNFAVPVQKKIPDPLSHSSSYGTGEIDFLFHAFIYYSCSFSFPLEIL